jgi:type IV secretory pathway VirB10-like protein
MSELIITNDARQLVITRLACINSAVSVFSLLHGRPAKSSIEDVLHLAERLEAWAWRGLLPEAAEAPVPEASTPQAPPDTPQAAQAPVSARRPNQVASEKQRQALYAIGQRRGLDRSAVQARVQQQLGKAVEALTSREASGLISQWLDQ